MDIFTSEQLQSLFIVAIATTFVVSAINVMQGDRIRGSWVTGVAAIIITLLRTTFTPGMSIADWQGLLSQFLLTTAFAILFWTYVGQYTVDRFFAYLKTKITEKYGGESTKP